MAVRKKAASFLLLFLILQLLILSVNAAECSAKTLCKTGCCSKDGYCGTTSAHCGTGCLSTCDYKPPKAECSKTKHCKTGCCSKDGFCGTSSAHCGKGCLSTCDYKKPPTECSKTRKCATGCCSKDGFCGTTDKHCGKGCQSTCDFKLGCDKNNPCKDGSCCSKFGFCGFGPDFCSKDNCVTGCNAKTFCDPGGYGSQFANHTSCPLNVCCSKFGYCGLTEEFCGKKKVRRPSCSASDSKALRRVVGYYEGWAPARSCDAFFPSQIPDGVYTHINFAFATIDPKTFEISPASKADPVLYDQLAEKKYIDPNLKVFIAIGGWAFNDPGPTATTFSDMARSTANQKKFIASIIRFMYKYNFDGVDIDWEYPEAPDRHGRGEDFKNLPQFLANLKTAMRQNGFKDGLSLAIPASYWYLQHFDIKKIAKHVDFFNLMTYDFHGMSLAQAVVVNKSNNTFLGSWDTPKSWLGNHLNSHTNLTEIKDSLDLLWRNDIDPDQVNMGLAFYARTFTASDPSCMTPGCLFDAGGDQGSCTKAVGVLSNSEIRKHVLSLKSSSTELDKTAAVKIVTSGRQWLTYDDGDTWKLKLNFARSQCLGGAMVWAVSQDSQDGKYSKELQSVTRYKSNRLTPVEEFVDHSGLSVVPAHYEASIDVTQEQCRWSNCGKGCPNGWKGVTRQDHDRHKSNELMLDDTACSGRGSRVFCCPPGKQPYCEWQHFKRGKCSSGCDKFDQYEVGSTTIGCHNGYAQVACCSGDTPALDAYRQCSWKGRQSTGCSTVKGDPYCDWNASFNTLLTTSWDGSGDETCGYQDGRAGLLPNVVYTPREYCCNSKSNDDAKWTNCAWYHKGLSSSAGSRESQCDASCPDGMVKLALQAKGCDSGKQAFCCDADVGSSEDTVLDRFEAALKSWVKHPTCPNSKGPFSRRSLPGKTTDKSSSASFLTSPDLKVPSQVRQWNPTPSEAVVLEGLAEIIVESPNSKSTEKLRHVWDEQVVRVWDNLDAESLAALWQGGGHGGYGFDSKKEIALNTMCNMDDWDDEMRKKKDDDEDEKKGAGIYCPLEILDTTDKDLLLDPEDAQAQEKASDFADKVISQLLQGNEFPWLIGRSGSKRDFPVTCPEDNTKFQLFSEPYPNGGNGDNLAKANNDQHRYYVDNSGGSCFSCDVKSDGKKANEKWVSEHILELQAIARFVRYTMKGETEPPKNKKARDGYSAERQVQSNPAAPDELAKCHVWREAFLKGFPHWNVVYPSETPMQQLYSQLGSVGNSGDMVNCEAKLNSMKMRVWSLYNPVAENVWDAQFALTTKASAEGAIAELQLGVWQYLNKKEVQSKLITVHMAIADFLEEFEELYLRQYKVKKMGLAMQWRSYMVFHTEQMLRISSIWAEARLIELQDSWEAHEQQLLAQHSKAATSQLQVAQQLLRAFKAARRQIDKIYTFDQNIFLDN